MPIDAATQRGLLEALISTIVSHTDELTDLDRAIGDADHGANMNRGFTALRANLDALSAVPLAQALGDAGRTLVMTVGGASGPLYGSFFMALGQQLAQSGPLTHARVVVAFDAAVAAVKARGKSEIGQKTMLDVLVPVRDELRAGGAGLLGRLCERAAAAAAATVPMVAQRGRASYLGERSAGYMDPGARSSHLLIEAACASLRGVLDD